jgi:hypothetical protein
LCALAERIDASLGPASSVRATADVAIVPLLSILGFGIGDRRDTVTGCWLQTTGGSHGPLVLVSQWEERLDLTWRAAVTNAIVPDVHWCFCTNGRALRIVDARRTWSRAHLEFDLRVLGASPEAIRLLWALVRADAMRAPVPAIEVAAVQSAALGVEVCRALGDGVLDALQRLLAVLSSSRHEHTRHESRVALDHSLTVLYRVLFLLFAEARGLVPTWHSVYRDQYSLETIVSRLVDGRACRGLWQAVQAISRMAHAGCSAGELMVTAFNGRLFAPAHAAAFERQPVPDSVMRDAILAVSTVRTSSRASRTRIAYRELDVEQLGAVYERVLDFEPGEREPATLVRTRDVRKTTGTFYTPRSVTAFLVRAALGPLIEGRSADQILELRVLDPAMGSGAFLVGALRYLASAAEEALIREGRWHPSDIAHADRAALRRDIASRCLYGVDLNPASVQLARLSLWLATLAADRPLSFLDHHLVAGNSLIGASPDDIRRQPTRGGPRGRRHAALPLFAEGIESTLEYVAAVRMKLATDRDDSAAIVRDKERTLSALGAPGTPLARWSQALDLWCAGWFSEGHASLDGAITRDLIDRVLGRASTLPAAASEPLLTAAAGIAARLRFFHWSIAFPEVFSGTDPGFDAVLGNPPWDMVRGDSGDDAVREDRRRDARQMVDFIRESGIYRLDPRAHVNRYQLFLDRALQLVRRSGRVGLVLPAGVVTDVGAAPLRRQLFTRAAVDSVTGLDNRSGIFPIHRSVRFVLLTCTSGGPTESIACRFGVHKVEELDALKPARSPLVVTRRFLERVSGEDELGIPEMATAADLRILERITATVPRLGAADGWRVEFGRELNASDDREALIPWKQRSTSRPVIEGKQVDPFRVSIDRARFELAPDSRHTRRIPRRARLAYRDVASATNRLTLIAAIVPPRAVTTHTVFCLRTAMSLPEQQVLCALLNSFVANYIIRLRVTTHVTVSLVSRLPVPFITSRHRAFARLHLLSQALTASQRAVDEMPEYAELHAIVGRLYGLTDADFTHVLETFPLIPETVRRQALLEFKR